MNVIDTVGKSRDIIGYPQSSGDWYAPTTSYQILLVEPSGENKKHKILRKSIVVKTRKDFEEMKLDQETRERLQAYPKEGDAKNISSYLPSGGVAFSRDFLKAILALKKDDSLTEDTLWNKQIELGNFYDSFRTVLHARKISQLIAKTWWAYLEAKKTTQWDEFVKGEWNKINDSNILDGLIAREIFLSPEAPLDNPDPEDKAIYYPLNYQQQVSDGKVRSLILPSSRAWQGITLSLLLAGQAYYKNGSAYHQISQPILSTGETVFKYSLEVDWTTFNGEIKEIMQNQKSPPIAYHATIPYPPIPSTDVLSLDEIQQWVDAKDEDEGDFPFYNKKDGKYLLSVQYFTPPTAYIPLSCT